MNYAVKCASNNKNLVEMYNPPGDIVKITFRDKIVYMRTMASSADEKTSIALSSDLRKFLNVQLTEYVIVESYNSTRIHKCCVEIKVKNLNKKKRSRVKGSLDFEILKLEVVPYFSKFPINLNMKYQFYSEFCNLYLEFQCTHIYQNSQGTQNCCYVNDIIFSEQEKSLQQAYTNLQEVSSTLQQIEYSETFEKHFSRKPHVSDNEDSNDQNSDEEEKTDPKQKSIFRKTFDLKSLEIGGLDEQFKTIFQEAFAPRILQNKIEDCGQKITRGILLYGPPGCGKTLLARKISELLNATKITIVNGPELKSKWHGESEQNIRKLFEEPEKEMIRIQKGLIPREQMGLYVIIIDELDSFVVSRKSRSDDTNNSIVGQFLSKIDQINPVLENILIIGMTNRKSSLDKALLRPGRIETHIEVTIPNYEGRLSILNIHTKKLRELGFLDEGVDLEQIARITHNFTGAELESVIRKTTHYCMSKMIDEKTMSHVSDSVLKLYMEDLVKSVEEITPMMGEKLKEIESSLEFNT